MSESIGQLHSGASAAFWGVVARSVSPVALDVTRTCGRCLHRCIVSLRLAPT